MNQEIKERIEKIKRGEVPEGYKTTKSGTIPLHWDSIKLRRLAIPIKEKSTKTASWKC
jgi:type I restriction enzyme S subunit